MLTFIKFNDEIDELVDFFTSETWPFHGQENPKAESIIKLFEQGFYTENGNQTFWVSENGERIGILRLFDLEDPTCLFDIRLKESHRGLGKGLPCVKWITDYVFKNFPHIIRVEGHTRNDNFAMRKTFYKSGFVKEAYHRNAWPQGGSLYDSVGYAMIRGDWENGTVTYIEDDFSF